MRRILFLLLAATMLAVGAVPASAGGASVDRIEGSFESMALISIDPYVLAYLDCDWVQRVEKPDGSAIETMKCHLTGEFDIWVWDDELNFEGHWESCPECEAPTRAFVDGPFAPEDGCDIGWASDYWLLKDGSLVFADWLRLTATPSGNVSVTTKYPAEPLVC